MAGEVRSYQEHEFCKDEKCVFLVRHKQLADQTTCLRSDRGLGCVKTAKEFHEWLSGNGFFILKPIGAE